MSTGHQDRRDAALVLPRPRIALVGSPNSGKSTLFNALTGLRSKVGNYPGVTVSRYEGTSVVDGQEVLVEDLPGTYSLDALSPDEQIVTDVLDPLLGGAPTPDALVVTLDATTLSRSLVLLAQLLHTELPVCVVLTFTDELARRQGSVDTEALSRALGVPVVAVVAGRRHDLAALRRLLVSHIEWSSPVVLPPTRPVETSSWIRSVLAAAQYGVAQIDERTRRIDALLLHPVWGTLVFFVTMFVFFQAIFTVAAPMQDLIERFFGYLGSLVGAHLFQGWLSSFLSDALLGAWAACWCSCRRSCCSSSWSPCSRVWATCLGRRS